VQLLGVTSKTIAAEADAGVIVRIAHGRYDLPGSIWGFALHM
jgi:hypothetical protein